MHALKGNINTFYLVSYTHFPALLIGTIAGKVPLLAAFVTRLLARIGAILCNVALFVTPVTEVWRLRAIPCQMTRLAAAIAGRLAGIPGTAIPCKVTPTTTLEACRWVVVFGVRVILVILVNLVRAGTWYVAGLTTSITGSGSPITIATVRAITRDVANFTTRVTCGWCKKKKS